MKRLQVENRDPFQLGFSLESQRKKCSRGASFAADGSKIDMKADGASRRHLHTEGFQKISYVPIVTVTLCQIPEESMGVGCRWLMSRKWIS